MTRDDGFKTIVIHSRLLYGDYHSENFAHTDNVIPV